MDEVEPPVDPPEDDDAGPYELDPLVGPTEEDDVVAFDEDDADAFELELVVFLNGFLFMKLWNDAQ